LDGLRYHPLKLRCCRCDKGELCFGNPEDIARAVLFFLEPDNYVTGQVLTVDGGLTLKSSM